MIKAAININTEITPTIIKWLSLPCEKSRLRVLSLCTPKKAAATLLKVSLKLLCRLKISLMEAIVNKLN